MAFGSATSLKAILEKFIFQFSMSAEAGNTAGKMRIYCCDRKLSCARSFALRQNRYSINLTILTVLAGMTSTLINIRSSPIAF